MYEHEFWSIVQNFSDLRKWLLETLILTSWMRCFLVITFLLYLQKKFLFMFEILNSSYDDFLRFFFYLFIVKWLFMGHFWNWNNSYFFNSNLPTCLELLNIHKEKFWKSYLTNVRKPTKEFTNTKIRWKPRLCMFETCLHSSVVQNLNI